MNRGASRLQRIDDSLRLMDAPSVTVAIKQEALRLGFSSAGVCAAVTPGGIARFHEWLAAGYAGQMHYLVERSEAYNHPRHVLDGVRSIVMLTLDYGSPKQTALLPSQGRVARYAQGTDYHDVIHERLKKLITHLTQLRPGALARGVVDSAPLLEREFAQLAGLGWIGKNSLLLTKESGSYFFLAALLTDLELVLDAPHTAEHCGTCRACLDACPTAAFVAPYVLDARKCISYLTIELRQPLPAPLRSQVGDWLFGCDVCQQVCPWNEHRDAPEGPDFLDQPELAAVELAALFTLDEAAFRARFRDTPLWRPRRRGLLRNAAIVLGNLQPADGLPALIRGLDDVEPLVRGACAWALGRYKHPSARAALAARTAFETDADVCQELAAALGG